MAKPTTATVARGETFPHPVELPLTDKELLAYADQLADLDTKEREITLRHQSEKNKFKAEIEEIGQQQTVTLDKLRTKKEYKDIECYNKFDYFNGVCEIIRVDNDKVVKTRPMTEKEFRGERLFKEKEEQSEAAGAEANEGQIIGDE